MLDVVVNNMAFKGNPNDVNYRSLTPFNNEQYFHEYCPINYSDRESTLDVYPLDNVDVVLDGRLYCFSPGSQHRKRRRSKYDIAMDQDHGLSFTFSNNRSKHTTSMVSVSMR